jgi:hypothetical protein
MPLLEIRATFACDRCGEKFSVTIDPAYKTSLRSEQPSECPTWSVFEIAEDCIRRESAYDGSLPSVRKSGVIACGKCTEKLDAKIDKHKPRGKPNQQPNQQPVQFIKPHEPRNLLAGAPVTVHFQSRNKH